MPITDRLLPKTFAAHFMFQPITCVPGLLFTTTTTHPPPISLSPPVFFCLPPFSLHPSPPPNPLPRTSPHSPHKILSSSLPPPLPPPPTHIEKKAKKEQQQNTSVLPGPHWWASLTGLHRGQHNRGKGLKGDNRGTRNRSRLYLLVRFASFHSFLG